MNMQNTIIYKGIEIIELNGFFVFWYRNTQYTKQYKIIIPNEEPTAYHYLSCCRSIEECHCGKYPYKFTFCETYDYTRNKFL